MRSWSTFFAFVAIIIPTTMIAPQVFGLQNFTQWGGMYTDGWCTAHLASAPIDPSVATPQGTFVEQKQAPTTRPVWYASMHNVETCTAWVRSYCGRISSDGTWIVQAAYPYFRLEFLHEKQNVCAFPPSLSDAWFPR